MTIEDQLRAKRDALAALRAKLKRPHPPQDTAVRARISNKLMNLRREIEKLDTEKDDAGQTSKENEVGGSWPAKP